jgi:predicted HicB family RNase H-like nuclease
MATEEIKRLTLDIPKPLHTALKIKAAAEGQSMNQLLESWIREKLPNVPARKK